MAQALFVNTIIDQTDHSAALVCKCKLLQSVMNDLPPKLVNQ